MGDRHFTFHMHKFVLRSEAPFLCAYQAFSFSFLSFIFFLSCGANCETAAA